MIDEKVAKKYKKKVALTITIMSLIAIASVVITVISVSYTHLTLPTNSRV